MFHVQKLMQPLIVFDREWKLMKYMYSIIMSIKLIHKSVVLHKQNY